MQGMGNIKDEIDFIRLGNPEFLIVHYKRILFNLSSLNIKNKISIKD
jgi:hypothetical protein